MWYKMFTVPLVTNDVTRVHDFITLIVSAGIRIIDKRERSYLVVAPSCSLVVIGTLTFYF